MKRRAKLYLGLFLAWHVFFSCSKSVSVPEGRESYRVDFVLSGFTASVSSLDNGLKLVANSGNNVISGEQPLYFWSFNNGTLRPDLALDEDGVQWTVTPNNVDFVAGKAYGEYNAGRAASFRGVTQIEIAIPLKDVKSLNHLAFNASGSDTGPKALDLLYSVDNGLTFVGLLSDYDMSSIKGTAWGDIMADLTKLQRTEEIRKIIFRLVLKRGNNGQFNEKTGTIRIDNMRLSGSYDGKIVTVNPVLRHLYYHIFNSQDRKLVTEGRIELERNSLEMNLPLTLASGSYDVSFVLSQAVKTLTLPRTIKTADDYYLYNTFDNSDNQVFGERIMSLKVGEDLKIPLVLQRYYSQVKFEFTDKADLSEVGKIEIVQEHELPYYVPFSEARFPDLSDGSAIIFYPEFGKTEPVLQFNQFLGYLPIARDIGYALKVYNKENKIIREFSVSSTLKHNMKLTFKGMLLEGFSSNANFAIQLNEEWGKDVEQKF
ncbi:hypothetical protein ACR79P_21145 [Sphingobacterium spiritivorum]|uniref:hypothetical protein n=1 Tax=Sphingobacterium spiritivorum TaxID=258 RepID=UPI003DA2C22C